MASSRSGLFCAAFDCSNNKSVQKVRNLFRFQKEQFVVVYRKKDERSGGHQAYLVGVSRQNFYRCIFCIMIIDVK